MTATNGTDRSEESDVPAAIGFLAVCELETLGAVGGYLLLNFAGRPLEFHCTAPVRASRAQEILYGPTLEPFLHGEQIGRALVEKATAIPAVVITNRTSLLAVAPWSAAPVVALAAAGSGPAYLEFAVAANRLSAPAALQQQLEMLAERIAPAGEAMDFAEPFDRIREAIHEAHRDARQKAA